MPIYWVDLFLAIEAKDEDEAEKIVGEILNAKLPGYVDESIVTFKYDEIIEAPNSD